MEHQGMPRWDLLAPHCFSLEISSTLEPEVALVSRSEGGLQAHFINKGGARLLDTFDVWLPS
jgi:hypothetical protein